MFDCVYRDEVKQKINERMKYLDDARIMNKGDTEILNQIEGFEKALNQTYRDIDDIRTADVQPIKHGRWEYREDKYENDYICSNCKNKNDERTWFCPYCGVDMREDCYEHRKS